MKLITIFNYPNDDNHNKLCKLWLEQAKKFAGMPIHVWHEKDLPEELVVEGVHYEKKERVRTWRRLDDFPFDPAVEGKASHNVRFKLYNLCQETEPFIYVDADAIIYRSLDILVEASHYKPFICADHQQVPKHSANLPFKFLNSGVQVVGDPSFLDFAAIVKTLDKDKGVIRSGMIGTDQAILFYYCKFNEYDYTHKNVGFEWNSCAGYTTIDEDGNPQSEGLDYTHPVYINHYWGEFRPWLMDCALWRKL